LNISDLLKLLLISRLLKNIDLGFLKFFYLLILVCFGIIFLMLYADEKSQEEVISSEGKMILEKDQSSDKFIFDTSVNKGFGTLPFLATVNGKEFFVSGVPTSVINLAGTSFTALLNPNCLMQLQKAIDTAADGLEKTVIKECGEAIIGSSKEVIEVKRGNNNKREPFSDSDSIISACSISKKCGSCLIIEGQEKPYGDCNKKRMLLQDISHHVKSNNVVWPAFIVRSEITWIHCGQHCKYELQAIRMRN